MPNEDKNLEENVEESNQENLTTDDTSSELPEAEKTSDVEVSVEGEKDSAVDVDVDSPVTVQQIQFASFDDLSQTQGEQNKNLDILMDIRLQMTVELGRTELPIKKVLELTRGSIIELDKIAGEPVDLFANGKLVAHGEVVVIEDNFGLRITSITEPEDRIKGIS